MEAPTAAVGLQAEAHLSAVKADTALREQVSKDSCDGSRTFHVNSAICLRQASAAAAQPSAQRQLSTSQAVLRRGSP
jgi:hypothetical protein